MTTRTKALLAQAFCLALALFTGGQTWLVGQVNGAELAVSGLSLTPIFSSILTVQLLITAISFYLPGRAVAALALMMAAGSAWVGAIAISYSASPSLSLAATGEIEKLTGQAGTPDELAELIANPSLSFWAFIFIGVIFSLAILSLLTFIQARKWPTSRRTRQTERKTKSSFDLWDSQS